DTVSRKRKMVRSEHDGAKMATEHFLLQKCCGTRPICRQCVKMNRGHECEYDDKIEKSRTQKLEEKLARLESRIRELEANPIEHEESEGSSSSSTPGLLFHGLDLDIGNNLDHLVHPGIRAGMDPLHFDSPTSQAETDPMHPSNLPSTSGAPFSQTGMAS